MKAMERHKDVILADAQSASCMFFDLHNIWNVQLGKAQFSFKDFQTMYRVDFIQKDMYNLITGGHTSFAELINSIELPIGCSDRSGNSANSNNMNVLNNDVDVVVHLREPRTSDSKSEDSEKEWDV